MPFFGMTKKGTKISFDGKISPEIIVTVQDKNLKVLLNEALEIHEARDLMTCLRFAIEDVERKVPVENAQD